MGGPRGCWARRERAMLESSSMGMLWALRVMIGIVMEIWTRRGCGKEKEGRD